MFLRGCCMNPQDDCCTCWLCSLRCHFFKISLGIQNTYWPWQSVADKLIDKESKRRILFRNKRSEESTWKRWESERERGKKSFKVLRLTLFGDLFCPFQPPNQTHHTRKPPERDHHHIIGFKSRGRARCLAGGWDQSWESMTKHWDNASQITSNSWEEGAGRTDPRPAKDHLSVTCLNWFMCDLPKWIFYCIPTDNVILV